MDYKIKYEMNSILELLFKNKLIFGDLKQINALQRLKNLIRRKDSNNFRYYLIQMEDLGFNIN